MKKVVSLMLVLVMCLSLCACESEEERLRKKQEKSEAAYNKITENYIDALQEYNDIQKSINSIKALEDKLR